MSGWCPKWTNPFGVMVKQLNMSNQTPFLDKPEVINYLMLGTP